MHARNCIAKRPLTDLPEGRTGAAGQGGPEGSAPEPLAAVEPVVGGDSGMAPEPAHDPESLPAAMGSERTGDRAVPVRIVSRANAPLAFLLISVAIVLWLARGVLSPFVIAGVLAYAFSPVVSAAQQRTGWRRSVIVGIGYVVVFAVVGILAYLLAGRASDELGQLSAANPDSLAAALRQVLGTDTITIGTATIKVADVVQQIQTTLAGFVSSPGSALDLARQTGDIALNTVLVIIVTFYLLVDGQVFIDRSLSLVPEPSRNRIAGLLGRIHEVLGHWLVGELFLIVLVATVVYLILGPVLGLRYALAIGVLTGILEAIPLVGPAIAAAIAALDAFVQGGTGLAIVVIVIYVVLREVEDQLVMPLVIGRAVHLHPVVTIFAVLVGLSAFGILGGLLGVPAAAAANVVFNELYRRGADEDGASDAAH